MYTDVNVRHSMIKKSPSLKVASIALSSFAATSSFRHLSLSDIGLIIIVIVAPL
jgi:hypothetical protein